MKRSLKSFRTIFPSSQLLQRVHCKFLRKFSAARSSYDRLWSQRTGSIKSIGLTNPVRQSWLFEKSDVFMYYILSYCDVSFEFYPAYKFVKISWYGYFLMAKWEIKYTYITFCCTSIFIENSNNHYVFHVFYKSYFIIFITNWKMINTRLANEKFCFVVLDKFITNFLLSPILAIYIRKRNLF